MLLWTWGYIHFFELLFFVSFGYILTDEIAGWYSNSIFNFWEFSTLLFTLMYQFSIPATVHKSSFFLHILTSTSLSIFRLTFNRHEVISHWCIMIPHGFICISLMTNDVEHLSCIYWPFIYLWKSVQIFCSFLNWVTCGFFATDSKEFFICFRY